MSDEVNDALEALGRRCAYAALVYTGLMLFGGAVVAWAGWLLCR